MYVGSAQRGLSARIARHFQCDKRRCWHIDYLTAEVRPTRALAWALGREAECRIAQALARRWPVAVPGFGASDCRCGGHLFGPVAGKWHQELERAVGAADAVIVGDEEQ